MDEQTREDIKKACQVLREGGVILYPTDTIWGLGCDASNSDAVRRIFSIKQREDSKSMLMLLDSDAKLNSYVPDIPDIAYDLIDMAERPLTIVYDNVRYVAPELNAEDGSVGIRITKESFSKELCARFKGGIVSTSANISGAPSPSSFKDISKEIIDAVDYVVSFRQNEQIQCKPSSIIKLGAGGLVKIIRE
ncbi:MAG: threonylcarbamoyl-AMP synthase [Bacteroidaceae bacterium]|nr:threonylcarbamoyl-AMP synthase [Bacteroidaceae bacterium]